MPSIRSVFFSAGDTPASVKRMGQAHQETNRNEKYFVAFCRQKSSSAFTSKFFWAQIESGIPERVFEEVRTSQIGSEKAHFQAALCGFSKKKFQEGGNGQENGKVENKVGGTANQGVFRFLEK